jgi:hypothetical protein
VAGNQSGALHGELANCAEKRHSWGDTGLWLRNLEHPLVGRIKRT